MGVVALMAVVAAISSESGVAAEPASRDPFPSSLTKKGLQVQMTEDALTLGSHHAALNVDLTRLIEPVATADAIAGTSQGKTFTFNRTVVEDLDRRIKPLSDRGVAVYLILLPYASKQPLRDRLMLHPDYDSNSAAPIAMFNVATADGTAWLTAACEFLAGRYSARDGGQGRVWGYIAGNEVNSHGFWANMGAAPVARVVDAYARAVRLIHAAVRRSSAEARIYISLDHCWSIRYAAGNDQQCMAGRTFIDAFAATVREYGDFDWHIAYHPYPEPLTDCRFWLDSKNAPHAEEAAVVTFRNLDVLVKHLGGKCLLWQGKARRIILSEQGFNCSDKPDGETLQAAAFALAWKRINQLELIDAFILHRHVDHSREGGLKLGLWTNKPGSICTPARKRPIYDLFRAAGTLEQDQAFDKVLPVLGASSWNEALERMMRD